MLKYRRKELVEAWQSFDDCGNDTAFIPMWIIKAIGDNIISDNDGRTTLRNGSGYVIVSDGDWIIRNENGQLSVMNNTVFEKTYEPVRTSVESTKGTN